MFWGADVHTRGLWHQLGRVVAGLMVGMFMGYVSLAAGPIGLLAAIAVAVALGASDKRAWVLGPFLIGAGISGGWLLLPALTNTDPAVHYPAETGMVPFVAYALVAAVGCVLVGAQLRTRRATNR